MKKCANLIEGNKLLAIRFNDSLDLQEVQSIPMGKIHASTDEHYIGTIWFWFTMIAL